MELSKEHSQARQKVFHHIGVNVIRFQQIERMLKILLNRGHVEGTVEELKRRAGRNPVEADKRMLGQLIDPLIENHLTPVDSAALQPPVAAEVSFSFRISFPLAEEERNDFKKQLEAIVAQRNELIHHSLDWLHLDSVEECRAASQRLQHQHEEMEPVYRRLRSMVTSLTDLAKRLRDEFPQVTTKEQPKVEGGAQQ